MNLNTRLRIDLHIHSRASDGSLTPSEILALAQRLKLGAIAITDHDTLDGSKEALANGLPNSLKFLTGIEISVTPPPPFVCSGSFHILGYAIDLNDFGLNQKLQKLQAARKNRNPQIVKRLNQLGMELTFAELLDFVPQGQIGRPHIAQLMVKKGYAESISAAFDNFLGQGKPAYVDKFRMTAEQAIHQILAAGGVPVLAHPLLMGIQNEARLEDFIASLKSMGLKGIEVYYPENPPHETDHYIYLARQHELLMTGGTDFHGTLKPEIQMGTGKGDFFVPYALYQKLVPYIH